MFLQSDFKFERSIVVLVAINPLIFDSFTMKIISFNCSLDKSGAIFNKIGFLLFFLLLRFCK